MDLIRKREVAAPPPATDPREFVMSDGSVDRMGDVIEPDGWRLERFHRNPVALFNHNPEFPIGTWRDVAVRKGKLTGRLELMEPVSYRLKELHEAVEAGVLRAVSVGFHSDSFEPLGKSGGVRFTEAELKKTPDGTFQGEIPQRVIYGESLQFYFEGRNAAGKPIARNGNERSPNLITIVKR